MDNEVAIVISNAGEITFTNKELNIGLLLDAGQMLINIARQQSIQVQVPEEQSEAIAEEG